MQDHSHKYFFLALTGAMCAAAVYGSQAGPSLFLSDTRPVFTVAEVSTTHGLDRAAGLGNAIRFTTAKAVALNEETSTDDAPPLIPTGMPKPGAATAVPNRSSCPAADANTLVSPATVNSAIGSLTPLETAAPPAEIATDAVLGTGSSCPPLGHDTHTDAKALLPGAISPNPQAATALPHAVAHP